MEQFHPLCPTRTVIDPIHGKISLTEEEMSVINHGLFRRLHRVRQNGLLYLVFPSASHTRFEHSIGALFVADAILQALFANSLTAQRKSPAAVVPLGSAVTGQAVELCIKAIGDEDAKRLFRYGRLAALVHDLGHGPFSHHFDPFAPRRSELRQICESTSNLGYLLPLLPSEPGRVNHELMSCVLFTLVADQLGFGAHDAQVVAAIILGNPQLCPVEDFRRYISLLHDIVASAPADADQMDYLERDSRSVGVSYGLFDRNRLLKSFLAYAGQDGLRLGIKRSGARAVENFVQARFELFVQIYYHKTNRGIQLMLAEIAQRAAALETAIFQWGSAKDLESIYVELSDERFLRVLRGLDKEWPLDDQFINEIAEDIFQRHLWKRVHEGEDSPSVAEKLQEKGFSCVADKVDPKATKDLEEGARLLSRDSEGVYRHTDGKSWNDESDIIRALAKAQGSLARVYLKSNDAEEARRFVRTLRTGEISRA